MKMADSTERTDLRVIGITGGIGAGKSVMSRLLRLSGFLVYDCDWKARLLMDADESLPADVARFLGEECVDDSGRICRPAIAAKVFADAEALAWLNKRVHGLVANDFRRFCESVAAHCSVVFVEAAVLRSSGLWCKCDEIWIVTAPDSLRVSRVCERNGISPDEVRARISSQQHEFEFSDIFPPSMIKTIANDGSQSLIRQLHDIFPEIIDNQTD